MFAKKLKNMKKSVTLDIISGLPHGFLNLVVVSIIKSSIIAVKIRRSIPIFFLTKVSKEAHEGSLLCAKRIRELMDGC